ncbi:hypothetical protein OA2633_11380 [Oceanicaulis alexandrii HTCC2633]|nr:hypothetical protein OA2633_11380 [Oceanicaulis alexandrii HTCC2633] [Oceanicaulis sp. HTCC2633]
MLTWLTTPSDRPRKQLQTLPLQRSLESDIEHGFIKTA